MHSIHLWLIIVQLNNQMDNFLLVGSITSTGKKQLSAYWLKYLYSSAIFKCFCSIFCYFILALPDASEGNCQSSICSPYGFEFWFSTPRLFLPVFCLGVSGLYFPFFSVVLCWCVTSLFSCPALIGFTRCWLTCPPAVWVPLVPFVSSLHVCYIVCHHSPSCPCVPTIFELLWSFCLFRFLCLFWTVLALYIYFIHVITSYYN